MPRYFFSIRNGRPFEDRDGLELADLAAARDEATGFARDMMKQEPHRHDWGGWIVRVTDEERQVLFELPFLDTL